MNVFSYYNRYQRFRGSFSGLPPLGRLIIGLLALPGIVLILLSLLALGVSILALLVLTVPAYRLLRTVFGGAAPQTQGEVISTDGEEVMVEPAQPANDPASPGRRQIDVKIIE